MVKRNGWQRQNFKNLIRRYGALFIKDNATGVQYLIDEGYVDEKELEFGVGVEEGILLVMPPKTSCLILVLL